MSERLDRIEQTLERVAAIVQQMGERTEARLHQHLELDDHDTRVEAMERLLVKHDSTIAEMKDVQKDIRAILQIMTARFSGEPPMGDA
jgi:DNA repair ATPase RecN